MITGLCVFFPIVIGLGIGEIISKLFPEQMEKLVNKIIK